MVNAAPNMAAIHNPLAKPQQSVDIGRVLSVGSAKAMVTINKKIISDNKLHLAQLGSVLKIVTHDSIVVTMVSSLEVGGIDDEGMHDGCVAQLDILGEITTNKTTLQTKFFRGVRTFPVIGEPVFTMFQAELELIFNRESEACIEVGRLQQDNNIIAKIRTDDLLSKHFAILGSTGSGKSCTVALLLQATLDTNPNARIVLFDPHNEYSKSFGDRAMVIKNENLDIPIWMFNFEETVEILASEIEDQAREEREILHDLILKAKQMFERSKTSNDVSTQAKIEDIEKDLARIGAHISLDSPVPYRIRDVLKLLNHYMGKLENSNNILAYKRLKRRIEMLLNDPRYKFMFRNQAAPSNIEDIMGLIFRLPVQGKPISILDFSGIPSESLNIVVSVISRLAFDLAVWSERQIPILLVCEEAHRYIPANRSLGFNSTRKIISRIAKEGRKYGVSLGIISQRPSELEANTLSQCSTIFSMRLSNEIDQDYVKAAAPDGASELLNFLPSLGTAEAMVFGESVNMPMRVILNTLAEEYRPHSSSASFTDLWAHDVSSPAMMAAVFENWRTRSLKHRIKASPASPAATQQAAPRVMKAPTQGRPLRRPANTLGQAPTTSLTPPPQTSLHSIQSLEDVKRVLNGSFNQNI